MNVFYKIKKKPGAKTHFWLSNRRKVAAHAHAPVAAARRTGHGRQSALSRTQRTPSSDASVVEPCRRPRWNCEKRLNVPYKIQEKAAEKAQYRPRTGRRGAARADPAVAACRPCGSWSSECFIAHAAHAVVQRESCRTVPPAAMERLQASERPLQNTRKSGGKGPVSAENR